MDVSLTIINANRLVRNHIFGRLSHYNYSSALVSWDLNARVIIKLKGSGGLVLFDFYQSGQNNGFCTEKFLELADSLKMHTKNAISITRTADLQRENKKSVDFGRHFFYHQESNRLKLELDS